MSVVLRAVVAVVACAAVARGGVVESVRAEARGLIAEGSAEGADLAGLQRRADTLVHQATAYAGPAELEAIREAVVASIAVELARAQPKGRGQGLLAVLRDHPHLAAAVTLHFNARTDSAAGVGRVVLDLAAQRPGDLDRFPTLAAAVALVFDDRAATTVRVNENSATGPRAGEVFAYFAGNAGRLAIDPSTLPAPLLTHVVDTASGVEELGWALGRYGKDPAPGRRFFEIDYDYDHLTKGTPKAVTAGGGFGLRAIFEHGGVCADQAFFASEVGKACGVPSVYVVAQGAEVGHAWVGFIEGRGGRWAWNMDAGRYEPYRNLRGVVRDAADGGKTMSDAELTLTAGLVGLGHGRIWNANAVAIAVWRWHRHGRPAGLERPGWAAREARPDGTAGLLALLRAGVEEAPASVVGWSTLAGMARDKRLSERELDEWAKAVDRLCGGRHAEFAVWLYDEMFAGVEDPERKLALLEWVHGRVSRRPDLASEVRFRQAAICRARGDTERAWWALMDVVQKHANEAPQIVAALRQAEALLRERSREQEIAPMYASAWRSMRKPARMAPEFAAQSNWFRVGSRYREVLAERGQAGEAAKVGAALGVGP